MATYTVKPGDTISKIARDVLGNMDLWPDVARLNNINAPYTIFPGQELELPEVTDSESIFYKGGAGKGEPLPTAPAPAPSPASVPIERAAIDINWPLIALAIAGIGLLWYGFKK